jgi:quercetin dioxygenase-like cupin family protein
MTSATMTHKKSRAVQPGEGESYWQPLPANGFVELALTQADNTNGPGFDVGIQEVAPDCSVREHVHDHHEEVIIVLEGDGTVTIDGEAHPMHAGTILYLAPGSRHQFINHGKIPLRFCFVLTPSGLKDFFSAIGRPRKPGEDAPEPFERPVDVKSIEKRTVFGSVD